MRITWITASLASSGGTAVVIRYANMLSDLGHEVSIISRPNPRLSPRESIKKIAATGKLFDKIKAPTLFVRPRVRVHILDRFRQVKDLDVPDGDIVVATFWTTAQEVMLLSPSKGQKYYFMQDYGGPNMPLDQVSQTWLLPLNIITISKYLKNLVEAFSGRDDIRLLPNAVSRDELFHCPRERVGARQIGFVYRPGWIRGYDIVSAAFQISKIKVDSLRLVMFGKSSPPQLGSEVNFVEQPSNEIARQLYRSCDAWIFASRLEGFGLPILEAMSQRTPVIATRAGASPELVNTSNGALVEPNPLSMAEQIIRITEMHDEEWIQMSNNAFDSVKDYHWEHAVRILVKYFSEY